MLGVGGVCGERDSSGCESCGCPAGRREFGVSNVGRGGHIQNVNSLMLGIAAIANMPVDVGLKLFAWSDYSMGIFWKLRSQVSSLSGCVPVRGTVCTMLVA